jgi:hypothetical protein
MYLRELIYDYIHPFTLSNFRLWNISSSCCSWWTSTQHHLLLQGGVCRCMERRIQIHIRTNHSIKKFFFCSVRWFGWVLSLSFAHSPFCTNDSFTGVDHGDATISFLDSIKDDISLIWHGGDISYVSTIYIYVIIYMEFIYSNTNLY